MKDVVFITVQYNNAKDTENFVASVGRMKGASGCEVVVVDNSDAPPYADAGRKPACFDIHAMRPPKNLYYWGGAAFALESLYGSSGPWPRWLVVCNNDIEIIDEDFLTKLDRLDPATHPIVAPSILSLATGDDQNPILETYPGWLKRTKWKLYDVSYPLARLLLSVHAAGKSFRTSLARPAESPPATPIPRRIYAPHGACMIFSSTFFERGGRLDTDVPLFAEELTIAAVAEKLSIPVWYCPDIRISHREHSTTGHRLSRAKYEMERLARRRYYECAR